jgi:glycine/D-amino acid oxidase-like deaminating enzyme
VSDVAVIGAGYVGLPLALHLARAGLTVTAVDIDADEPELGAHVCLSHAAGDA